MRNGGIQLRLGDFLHALSKRWKLILALSCVGLAFGFLLSLVSNLQGYYSAYRITGSFSIRSKNQEGAYASNESATPHPGDIQLAEDLVDAVSYVIRSDVTLNSALAELQRGDIHPGEIARNLTLKPYNATQIVEASLTWRDGEEGIQILGAVLHAANSTLLDSLDVGELVMLNGPACRKTWGGGLLRRSCGILVILGFLAGVCYAVLEQLIRPKLTNLRDVEGVLHQKTLGVIPRADKLYRSTTPLLLRRDSEAKSVNERYAAAAYLLQNRFGDGKMPRCFYVTSAAEGEGKTTAAASLALQLAQMEKKVLLLDLDLENPALSQLLLSELDPGRSLNALCRGETTGEKALYQLTASLDFVPSNSEPQPMMLDSALLEQIRSLGQGYDYLILDAAPVGQSSQVLRLNEIADGALLVARYDMAELSTIRAALEKLEGSGIPVLGLLVNAAQKRCLR